MEKKRGGKKKKKKEEENRDSVVEIDSFAHPRSEPKRKKERGKGAQIFAFATHRRLVANERGKRGKKKKRPTALAHFPLSMPTLRSRRRKRKKRREKKKEEKKERSPL